MGARLGLHCELLLMALCAAGLLIPSATQASAAGAGDDFPALRALVAKREAALSALAVDLHSGELLWQVHPERALTPASVSKLYVSAAALRRWGPEKRFTTRLLVDGRLHDGVLRGDLVLLGGGAPALSAMQLWQLAQRAHDAGLRRVTGDLVVNESKFGPVACSVLDRCKAERVSRHAYAAPLSAAAVNFNTWCVAIRPGAKEGSPARVSHCEDVGAAPAIKGKIDTVAASRARYFHVKRTHNAAGELLHVRGSLAATSGVRRIYRAVGEPSLHSARVFRQVLDQAGVKVEGDDRVSYDPPAATDPLAEVEGKPLRVLLPQMLSYSNNFMADMLTLDLADAAGAKPPLELDKAASVLAPSGKLSGKSAVASLPADAPPRLRSGSGLSVDSRVSAVNLVALLANMYRRPALFPSFLGALTVPMYSPFAFLNESQGLWSARSAIKTGVLHEPVTVLSAAGYIRLPNGDRGAIAILVNGTPKHRRLSIHSAVQAIEQDLNTLLRGS